MSSQPAARASSRVVGKPQTPRAWCVSWMIAAPASIRGELTWLFDTAGAARCVLDQQGLRRDVVPAAQASVTVIDGLTHVTVTTDHDRVALLATLDATTGKLLYVQTATLADLGVLGGRAEPPVMSEVVVPTRSTMP